jgi:aerobic-type carbon monoxide dehydrogenase small subunit (CoxS/CutS family)
MTVAAGRLAGRGRPGSSALVNGTPCELGGPAGRSLLALLRADLGLTGVKPGCGEGECGACTVLVDGAPVLACQTTLAEVAGRAVTTIEGLASGGRLHPVQQALAEQQASQCGYCTPGMALRAAALLAADDARARPRSGLRWNRTCAGAAVIRG